MKKWMLAVISVIAVIILTIVDQVTKVLTLKHIADQSPITLIKGVLSFTFVKNQGSAFGLMQGKFTLFYIMTVIIMAGIVFVFLRTPMTKRFAPIYGILVLLTAGAFGNTYDRIFRGYVVDMIYFEPINFPVFNVADCYVTVSCFLLVILLLFKYKDEELEIYSLKKMSNTKTSNLKDKV